MLGFNFEHSENKLKRTLMKQTTSTLDEVAN